MLADFQICISVPLALGINIRYYPIEKCSFWKSKWKICKNFNPPEVFKFPKILSLMILDNS